MAEEVKSDKASTANAANTADPKKEETKEAGPSLKDKIIPFLNYDNIPIIEGVLVGLHLIAFMLMSFQYYMLIVFFLIRIPRGVLHGLARYKADGQWPVLEYKFRKITAYAYGPIAILFQTIGAQRVYCYYNIYNNSSCVLTYSIVWIILILIHTAFDVLFWRNVI
jgi:hypothetical protein